MTASRRGERVWLLDANLLIALTHAAHVHHVEAHRWFGGTLAPRRWASCALTQLAFVRLTSNPRVVGDEIAPAQALDALEQMTSQRQHEFWDEAPSPLALDAMHKPALVGHRRVTDAYLLGLAARRGQCLATLDRGLLSFAVSAKLGAHIELVSAPLLAQAPAPSYPTRARVRSRA